MSIITNEHLNITALANKLTALKQVRFGGHILLKSPLGQAWTFYLHMGRIVYATGGTHPVRQWKRNLAVHCFKVNINQLNQIDVPPDLSVFPEEAWNTCWEYYLLCLWVQQQKILREQLINMVQGIVTEVLFDVTQAMHVTCEEIHENPLSPQWVLIDPEQAVAEAQKIWQTWKAAGLSDLFPNQAPFIKQPEQLQQKTSPAVYKSLSLLLDGQQTLRDIAIQTNRNVTEVTRSLLPYIQAGLVDLTNIADLAVPIPLNSGKTLPPQPTSVNPGEEPLIACVDDSPLVCQTMEKILTAVGYRFIAVQDSMRAVTTLLARKPELIFLDLVMPNTNGYEICTQLRKVSAFRDTPIIILTGNDGIIDRVRAKVVGASDFLGKPVEAEKVLAVAAKYLKHLKNNPLVIG